MSGGGARVSIPASERKVIQNIMEIVKNHSEEETYAMFLDCSRDPDETTERLLAQDPFHEVKRKRDRRKENKEPVEPRWKSGNQGRGVRGDRANFPLRFTSHDASRAKNSGSGRDNGAKQVAEKMADSSLSLFQETKSKDSAPESSSATGLADGSATAPSAGRNEGQPKLGNMPSSFDAKENQNAACGSGSNCMDLKPNSPEGSAAVTAESSLASNLLASGTASVAVNGSLVQSANVTTRGEVLDDQMPREQHAVENKSTKFHAVGKNQLTDSSQPSSYSNHGSKSGSRPSSNYGSRSQQIVVPQKVGSTKEWKPKPTHSNANQGSGKSSASEVPVFTPAVSDQARAASGVLSSDEATVKLQKKLEDLHIQQRQHVIIPNHIQVPESERTKLSFGSFDVTFGLNPSHVSGPEDEKNSVLLSQASQSSDEVLAETVSNQNVLGTAEGGDHPEKSESPSQVTEPLANEGAVTTNTVPEYNEPKQESSMISGIHQNSSVTVAPNHGLAFVPSAAGSQLTAFESTEAQARDVSRLPSFVVQQPFDPASYYAQIYRSGIETDGRVSPFHPPGIASKLNEPAAVAAPQTSQPSQEGANSFVVPAAGPTPLVTQPAGLMQSSINVTQQPVPVYRPPAGMPISHFQPNFFPYGHYYSPFYVSPPAMHQFLSNGAFPQQPQANNVYPAPPPVAGVKFPLPQYKAGTNAGNLAQIGMPGGYGLYGSSLAAYNPGSAASAGNSTGNEDLNASQLKENNVYITGQQNESSPVWMPGPGRDVSAMPATPFYNIPPQGQHVTFAPTQAVIYHPGQPVTGATVHPLLQQSQAMAAGVDMVTPAAGVYQQPQQPQINWPSNY